MEKFLWNATKTASVRSSKIRRFTIEEIGIEKSPTSKAGFLIVGWFSDTESFDLGVFSTIELARKFLGNIHKSIEGVMD